MLMIVKSQALLAEAANAASVQPCLHFVDETSRPGSVVTLAGRRAS
jgi:hypothetical protein